METVLRVRINQSPTLKYMTHTPPSDLPLLSMMSKSSAAGIMAARAGIAYAKLVPRIFHNSHDLTPSSNCRPNCAGASGAKSRLGNASGRREPSIFRMYCRRYSAGQRSVRSRELSRTRIGRYRIPSANGSSVASIPATRNRCGNSGKL